MRRHRRRTCFASSAMKTAIATTVLGLSLVAVSAIAATRTPARNSATEPDLATVRKATDRFRDVKVALAEGYIRDPGNMCDAAEMMGKPKSSG